MKSKYELLLFEAEQNSKITRDQIKKVKAGEICWPKTENYIGYTQRAVLGILEEQLRDIEIQRRRILEKMKDDENVL